MDRREFIEYYEQPHLDLITKTLPKHDDFRRNYPVWHRGDTNLSKFQPFDVMTAITYENRATFDQAMQIYHSQPFNKIVTEDELRFLDRPRMMFVMVDEVIDEALKHQWRPAPVVADAAKLVRLIRQPDALDCSKFREIYEDVQAPAIRSIVGGCIDYRRNYVRRSDSYNFMTPQLHAECSQHIMISFDIVEELCFVSSADAKVAAQALDSARVDSTLLMGMKSTAAIICDQRLSVT